MPRTTNDPTPPPTGGGRPALPAVLARNSMLNLLGLGLPLVVAVFAIPPILDGLGPARFGILGLVWVVVAYLGLLDLGLGRATTRYAATALGSGDTERLRSIVGVAAASQLVLGVIGGGAAALLAAPLVGSFLELTPALHDEAVRSFVVLALAAPVVALTNSFRGVLEADQRFGFVNAIRVPVSMANFLVPLIGVWLDWSLPAIVGWMVVVRAAGLVAYAGACLRAWPELRRPLPLDRGPLRELLGFGGWVTVSALVGPLLVYIDRFAVGAIASVEAAGYYTVPHEMVTRLEVLPASLVLTLFPALAALSGDEAGRAEARNDAAVRGGADGTARMGGTADTGPASQRAALIYRSVEYLLALVAPLLITLAVLSHDILTVWMGAEFAARADVPLRVLAVGMLANAVAFVPYAALQAAGRPDVTARFHLLELPVHLVVVWLLVSRWGLVGAAAAWSIRTTLDVMLLLGASAHLGLAPLRGWRVSRVPGLMAALALFAALAAGVALITPAAVQGIAAMTGLLVLWGAWAWSRMLGGRERDRLLAAVGFRRGR